MFLYTIKCNFNRKVINRIYMNAFNNAHRIILIFVCILLILILYYCDYVLLKDKLERFLRRFLWVTVNDN